MPHIDLVVEMGLLFILLYMLSTFSKKYIKVTLIII